MSTHDSIQRNTGKSHIRDLTAICLSAGLALACSSGPSAYAQPGGGPGQPVPPSFEDPVTFCTLGVDNEGDCIESRPMGLVVAELVDLPGEQDDGYPDVAVVNRDESGQQSVTVFHNTGDWSVPASALEPMGDFPVGWSAFPEDAYEIKAADVTGEYGDGDLDLIVTLHWASQLVILENLGLGQFGQAQFVDISPSERFIFEPRGLIVGDFDLDNRTDLAVAATDYEFGVGAVVLFWKQEDGGWDKVVLGAEHNMPSGYGTDIVAGAVAAKPVSAAFQDLVVGVTDPSEPYLVTLVNLSQRHFAPGVRSPAATEGSITYGPMGIALGHFRAGLIQPDLVTADEFRWPPEGDSADVYWNNAYGNFTFKQEYLLESGAQVGHDPYSVAVAKINLDPSQDIVSTIGHDDPCNPGGGIAVFVGYPDGTFVEPPYLFCVDPTVDPDGGPKPKFVKIGDLDQDGFNDVVTSNYNSRNISVLINSLQVIPGG